MSMTIAVTRNIPGRFKGFLSSCMLEIAPGVFVAPRMRKGIRDRAWGVMLEWAEYIDGDGGVVLFWRDRNAPSGLGMRLIGWPKKDLIEHEGIWMTVGALSEVDDPAELEKLRDTVENTTAEKNHFLIPSETFQTPVDSE